MRGWGKLNFVAHALRMRATQAIKPRRPHGQIQLFTFLFAADAKTRPHGEVSQGACPLVFFVRLSASAGEGNPQKSRGKNSSEEAAGARLRLVGSLRRTARAWGFSHHENPLAKPGCPSSIGAAGRPRGGHGRPRWGTMRDQGQRGLCSRFVVGLV